MRARSCMPLLCPPRRTGRVGAGPVQGPLDAGSRTSLPDHRCLQRHRRGDRPPGRRRPATALVLGARSADRLERLAAELGGPERAIAVNVRRHRVGAAGGAGRAALERFGRIDVAFANAGFGAKRGFLEETPEFWKSMVLTNVYGAALTIRATMPALKESRGPPAADRVGGRPPGAAGLAVLGDQVGGDRDGRVRPPGAQRHRRARDADRARDGRHPLLRQRRPAGCAAGRRRRPRGDVRRLAARARRRQRDPRQARRRSR